MLTVETLDEVMTNMVTASFNFTCFVIWSFISFINYNQDRIGLLEKKAEKYDALCEEVKALYEANKVDRLYADHLNRKIDSFIVDYKKKEKQK